MMLRLVLAVILIAINIMFVSCNASPTGNNEQENKELHNHEYKVIETEQATCEEAGYVKYKCECGEMDIEIVDALGHDFKIYKYNNDGTCTHNGTETAKCERCDEIDTREKANTKKAHDYINYEYQNNATCTKNGTEKAKCEHCDEIDIREKSNSKLPHEIERHDGKEAACEESGWKEYETCKNCEYTTYEEIPSKGGHNYELTICTECKQEDREGKLNELIINDGEVTGYSEKVSNEITEIEIPEGVEIIGEGAFSGKDKVTKVVLPSTLKKIKNAAFEGCRSLTELTIPEGVTEIGNMIFNNCEREITIYYEGTEEQWDSIIKDDARWAYDTEITLVFLK